VGSVLLVEATFRAIAYLLPALWNRDVVSLLTALIIRRFKRF